MSMLAKAYSNTLHSSNALFSTPLRTFALYRKRN